MIKTVRWGIMAALFLYAASAFSQTVTIKGRVIDVDTRQALAGAVMRIDSGAVRIESDESGRFMITTAEKLPFTLHVNYLGYKPVSHLVGSEGRTILIEMEPQNILGQEIVVAASRIPEKIFESPVSIERLGAENMRRSAEPSFYDAITKLKGVGVSTQSFTLRTINTRGFNSNGNTRFNQVVDGMDTQSPGLSFPVGDMLGLPDLDIETVELLPGVSSALYGAGGTNGTLLMTSKSPFDYPGLALQLGLGTNSQNSLWPELGFRYAKVINKKFGIKLAGSYVNAQDWEADDYSNFNRIDRKVKAGDRFSDPMYDGVNVYGDEPNLKYPTLNTVGIMAKAQAAANPALQETLAPIISAYDNQLLPNESVTRTGYFEKDLVDYNARSMKTSAGLYYKFSPNVQAIAEANWGLGTSVYTGSDRYSLQDFSISQYKLELKGKNFFLRGYTTQESSGDAYNATLLASLINESWKPSANWFMEYTAAFSAARLSGQSESQAHLAARQTADTGRPEPGTPAFNNLKDEISNKDIGTENGARFNDQSGLYHYEGMYNFSPLMPQDMELLGGVSYRMYALHSEGTIFDDLHRDIRIREYGAYVQASRKLGGSFKLSTSFRYDKNKNFSGRLTPRIAGLWTLSSDKNIRLSYQAGFRNPTAQNQYIDIAVAGDAIRLVGGLPEILKKYNLYENKGYTDQSYREFLASGNLAVLETYTFDRDGIQPERVKTFELGYRGLYEDALLIDAYGYYNIYRNFITGVEVYQNPSPGSLEGLQHVTRFDVPVNNLGKVTSWGLALGMDYKMNNYGLMGNISYNKLQHIPNGYFNEFNTPEIRFNLGASIAEIIRGAGLNLIYSWQSSYLWQSPFAGGEVPAFGTLDIQASIKLPVYNSIIRIGARNLLNNHYRTSYGNPSIGGTYYISLLFDQLLN